MGIICFTSVASRTIPRGFDNLSNNVHGVTNLQIVQILDCHVRLSGFIARIEKPLEHLRIVSAKCTDLSAAL